MIRIEPLISNHVKPLLDTVSRNQLAYHEYSFIDDNQLKLHFENQLNNTLASTNSYSYVAVSGSKIEGYIQCELNQFDSDNFGFQCYRISDLQIFSDGFQEVRSISSLLIESIEKKLASINTSFYISVSINNNTFNQDKIFNSLTSNGYYYIHTLLTFKSFDKKFDAPKYYPEEKLTIRLAEKQDAEQVSNLAEKSFRYSRFHMDPFLDDLKASQLLKQSALNSIIQGFVDVMFVAEIDKNVVGYYSAKKRYIPEFNKTIGNAVISAVNSDYRGIGLFSKMDSHLINWFADNTDFSEMGTYLVNYPVHKTWVNKELGLVRGIHQLSKFIK